MGALVVAGCGRGWWLLGWTRIVVLARWKALSWGSLGERGLFLVPVARAGGAGDGANVV